MARALKVVVYSDNVDTRQQIMLALGRRPSRELPEVEYTEVATEPMLIRTVDPGGFDLLGDDLPETDLVVTCASQGSTVTTWTFTLSNCKVVSAKSSLVGPDERRMWTLVLQHDDNVDADVSSVLS